MIVAGLFFWIIFKNKLKYIFLLQIKGRYLQYNNNKTIKQWKI